MRLPTAVDPVNEVMLIFGLVTSASPVIGPGPFTTLTTPAGTWARAHASASIRVVSGVFSAGLRTIVLPAAIAGKIFHAAICSG
jgi:hypothetical protein